MVSSFSASKSMLLIIFGVMPFVVAFQNPMNNVARVALSPLHYYPHAKYYRSVSNNYHVEKPSASSSTIVSIPPTCSRKEQSRVVLSSTMAAAAGVPSMAAVSMTLLALQFGTQPILVRKFATKNICRSTIVLAQDVVKFGLAGLLLYTTGGWASSVAGWSIREWWLVAGIPAFLYVIQNYCTLIAYQNLAPVTFNVLNQTKTLSAALCCYLVMGRVQSQLQVVSLIMLLVSALVIEKVVPLPFLSQKAKNNDKQKIDATISKIDEEKKSHLISGVIPLLAASFISGLAGALVQKSLQTHGRNTYMFTMELAAASAIMLAISLLFGSPDAKLIKKQGLGFGWTLKTWLPIFTNAGGGIVVGMVTKYAGAVRKGFALTFGLLLSGLLQSKLASSSDGSGGGGVTSEQVVGGVLASMSLWMYAKFPYVS